MGGITTMDKTLLEGQDRSRRRSIRGNKAGIDAIKRSTTTGATTNTRAGKGRIPGK
jgi:hypothetical protein